MTGTSKATPDREMLVAVNGELKSDRKNQPELSRPRLRKGRVPVSHFPDSQLTQYVVKALQLDFLCPITFVLFTVLAVTAIVMATCRLFISLQPPAVPKTPRRQSGSEGRYMVARQKRVTLGATVSLSLCALFLLCPILLANGAEDKITSAYLDGDFSQAAVGWSAEADRGDATAEYNLACMIAEGRGVPADRAKATIWFQKAADSGDLDARKWIEANKNASARPQLSWYFHKRPTVSAVSSGMRLSYRVQIDSDQEFVALCKNEKDESGEVEFFIGLMLESGKIGHPIDDPQAVAFFQKSSAMGYPIAQTNLAYRYAVGRGVPLDPAKEVALFRSAAQKGERVALANWAGFYETGKMLFPRDIAAAYALYELASERGERNIAPKSLTTLNAVLTDEQRKKAEVIKACVNRPEGLQLTTKCFDEPLCPPDPAFTTRPECR